MWIFDAIKKCQVNIIAITAAGLGMELVDLLSESTH